MIKFPTTHTVWGPINTLQDLQNAIAKSGQPFGVDESGPACNTVPTAPCDVTYYQYLGLGLHKGIDIPVNTGTEVFAVADGKVTRISDNITQGIGVVIYHPQLNIESVSWHLQSHNVKLSDEVKAGDLIALSDNTGYSEGPHLHFQINLTDEHGQSLNAVDPMPYFMDDAMDYKLVQVSGQKDVWLVKDNKRSLIFNLFAFQLINNNQRPEVIAQSELDLIPDSGFTLAGLQNE